jgi:hypothetical protein
MKKTIALLAFALIPVSANANVPMIEIGISSGAANTSVFDHTAGSVEFRDSLEANFAFRSLLLDANIRASGSFWPGHQEFSVQASGGLVVLRLHDFTFRKSDADGEEMRALAGIGTSSISLPSNIGRVSASLGAAYFNHLLPNSTEATQGIGAYAGASVLIQFKRVRNELQVAYYMVVTKADFLGAKPVVNQDLTGIDDIDVDYSFETAKGLIASNRLYYEAFRFPLFTIGPELIAEFAQLPERTEFRAFLGIRGEFKR